LIVIIACPNINSSPLTTNYNHPAPDLSTPSCLKKKSRKITPILQVGHRLLQ